MQDEIEEYEYKEVLMLSLEDKGLYYEIWCTNYIEPSEDCSENSDPNNKVDTCFHYNVDGYGWGGGGCGYVYTQDIKNMYEQLVALKDKRINKLSCTFKCESFYAGYYFKIIILQEFNGKYNAYIEVIDDLDTVKMWKSFSVDELEHQIDIWKKCSEEYPVR